MKTPLDDKVNKENIETLSHSVTVMKCAAAQLCLPDWLTFCVIIDNTLVTRTGNYLTVYPEQLPE